MRLRVQIGLRVCFTVESVVCPLRVAFCARLCTSPNIYVKRNHYACIYKRGLARS